MTKRTRTWVDQSTAAGLIEVSARTLLRFRQKGFLQRGEHYRNATTSKNSKILYCVETALPKIEKLTSRDPKTLEAEIVSSSQ